MTTEEQFQTTDIEHTNGTEDGNAHEHDNESTLNTNSSAPPVRRSRFFRSKRKQREHPNQTPDGNEDTEADQPSETSDETQQPSEENSTDGTVSADTTTPIQITTSKRSLSPPPCSTISDDSDEPDESSGGAEKLQFTLSSSSDDVDNERSVYLSNQNKLESPVSAQPRYSAPSIYAGYQRKKSQSVKLTRIDPIDSYPKKNVRFADDFGLDLSQVKVIKSDELPHVPSAAFKDLHISNDDSSPSFYLPRTRTISYLEQRFDNPIHAHGFEDRVSRHKVVLEQANAIDNRIYGTIKVVTFGLNKHVKIRLSTDNWVSHQDYDATYISDSYDGAHDRFTFTLTIDRDRIEVGNNIEFCIGYESYVGPEYWDNNYQQNYRFECVSRTIPDYSA